MSVSNFTSNDLKSFKALMKPKDLELPINNRIVGYTRVSSKQQLENFSLKEQENEIREYAKKNKYILDDIIGGTYESASGDFTRKEFKKLYDEIKKSRKRPYAIAIRFINRFSRTGAGAITIVHELVDKLGVHLIETSSGLCTDNLKSRTTIYHKLLEAMEENHERLEKTLPGMKSFLLNGNWLGVAPFGYTTHGPRVVDFSLKKENQQIVINADGKVLQKAWQWKLQGEKDFEILKKLDAFGIKITKQRLSNIWRNPFYCGVIINSLLEDPLLGKWEPMVSQSDFLQVQKLLNPGKGEKYKVDVPESSRPFSRFIICSQCGHMLTGYVSKLRNVHYYKCNVCHDVNLNANTTKGAWTPGLHNLFYELLKNVELKKDYIEPFVVQLKKTFKHLHAETKVMIAEYKKNLKELEDKLTKVEEKYLFDGLRKEIYDKYKDNLEVEILRCSQSIEEMENRLSNHEEFIDKAVFVIENLSKHWVSGNTKVKERIQKAVFPEGLVIDPKKRCYRTFNINKLLVITDRISKDCVGEKTKQAGENTDLSTEVAGIRLERMAFGL